ncbi:MULTISPECIES: matrixin family metalloprotease [unclassified Streptomyces]|uniref:matrixin family metalloprotease n=1 Tax=unclassified Streptomyces TaxID=2593676 RepID=UPI002255329E|nr:matrixin family metalloprotease [Streptomyces sp. NBC_01551]MCX4524609.1 matrixin family metalloprotease [Streptomyces sp. NBC_01551]
MRAGTRKLLGLPAVAVALLTALLTTAPPAAAGPLIGGHWAKDGLARAQIYFVDHTGANWPVGGTVNEWNKASGVDSYYVTSCPGSWLHCVNVWEWNDSGDNRYGVTFYNIGANGHFTSAEVWLNSGLARNATQTRKTACHEEGHVLGLDHQFTRTSCLMSGDAVANGISVYPSADDLATLKSLYAHGN